MSVKLLYSKAEASRETSLSERTLDRLRKSGELRAVRVGDRVLFRADDLREWIERNTFREGGER